MSIKNNLNKIKERLIHEFKEIKSIWIIKEEFYILISDLNKKEKKEFNKKIKKFSEKYYVKIYPIEIADLFRNIAEYNKKILINIRDSKLLYDKVGFIKVIKINIKEGNLVGTKEFLLKRFMNIDKNFREINSKKSAIFTNIYSSVIEASQAILFAFGYDGIKEKRIINNLKKLHKKEIINKEELDFVKNTIKAYKKYEHGEKPLPSPQEFNKLINESNEFIKKARNMVYK